LIYKQCFKNIIVHHESSIDNTKYTQIFMCSDGGQKDDKGSFGIVLKAGGKIVITLHNRVPKIYEKLNSHRCKCYGLILSIQLLLMIQKFMIEKQRTILPHKVLLCCDNKSVVDYMAKSRYKKIALRQLLAPNIDTIKAIIDRFHNVSKTGGFITFQYINSHQDKTNTELSPLAILNVEANKLATKGLSTKAMHDIITPTDKAIFTLVINV
jgi:hypothetical protein